MICGIDYNTHAIDVVGLSEEGPPRWWHYSLPAVGDAFRRTLEVAQVLPARRSVFWDTVQAVAIEEPYMKGPAASSFIPKLKCVQGAILSCLPPRLDVRPYSASVWRTRVGLSARASKGAVREWVIGEAAEALVWTQDACDAYCLARTLVLELEEVAA